MRAVRALHRLTHGIAALSILLASLAPSLSQAFASTGGAGWIAICTTQDARWTESGDDGAGGAPAPLHVPGHCPYCSLHAPTLGLPPAVHLVGLSVHRHHEVPSAFVAAPHTLHPWVSAQPRAPPSVLLNS